MKTLHLSFVVLLLTFISLCNAQTEKKITTNKKKAENINIYYFHFTARCITCKTVENESKKIVETLYPEHIKKGKISFKSINIDDPSSAQLVKLYNVGGQSLLITKGNIKIDITREGFMYARTNPEKLKVVIKEQIDRLLSSK